MDPIRGIRDITLGGFNIPNIVVRQPPLILEAFG